MFRTAPIGRSPAISTSKNNHVSVLMAADIFSVYRDDLGERCIEPRRCIVSKF